jgi:hypothetical protein
MLVFARRTFCRRTIVPRGRAPPRTPCSNCALPNPGAAFINASLPRDAASPATSGDAPEPGAHRPETPH